MGIKREQHSLDRSLRGFFVIDVAGVVLLDNLDAFAVIAFNLVRFKLVCGKSISAGIYCLPPAR